MSHGGSVVPASHRGLVVPASRRGSVVPASCRGSVVLASHRGSVAPASRGGSVAPASHGGSAALGFHGGSVAPASHRGSAAPSSCVGSISGSILSSHSISAVATSGVWKGLSTIICACPGIQTFADFPQTIMHAQSPPVTTMPNSSCLPGYSGFVTPLQLDPGPCTSSPVPD